MSLKNHLLRLLNLIQCDESNFDSSSINSEDEVDFATADEYETSGTIINMGLSDESDHYSNGSNTESEGEEPETDPVTSSS
ncbi:unnamed protein product [Didymodactylos carnosus]|uniref:Uncharacterized protein n=1 Tax=Didymodactylos carnosus TaxID=1234261 RepID=A0A815PFH7_9BILA|nr:unnamed protein product [Didymodactylos carnosus]CAF1448208.1 unnamed protein product [Didymodactylos carnosus]CAF3890857.1 unnamed protein product [Didymodactylos carnosus]CAF4322411.1 unnamed protein product [Didymodactylos carnosus]